MALEREYLDWLPLFPDETEQSILDRMIDWANEGLTPDSDGWVDTREGSMWRTAVIPMVREMARIIDMLGVDLPASGSPLRAWGPYLDEHAEVVDVDRLPATSAQGVVRFTGATGTTIPAGAQVGVAPTSEDSPAPTYAVTTGGTIPAALATPAAPAGTPSATGGAIAAGTYYYKVVAVNAYGTTVGSAETSVVVPGTTVGSVALTVTPVTGATGYRWYRGTVTNTQTLYYTSTAPAFTDIGGASTAGTVPVSNTSVGTYLDRDVTALEPGTEGNVSALAITELLTPISGVTVSNALPMLGGTEPETDEALRSRLLEAYRGQGAGNPGDYRRWARSRPGVGRVTVIPVWDGPGTVLVIVTDADGQPVSAAIVDDVQEFLDPVAGGAEGYAPIGAAVTVATPTVLDITITANVEPEPGYSLTGGSGTTALNTDLRAAVDAYLKTVESGGEVVRAQVARALMSVLGVHDVASIVLSGAEANGNVLVPADPPRVPISTTQTYTEASI